MAGGHGGRGALGAGLEAVAAGDSPVHRLDARAKIVGLIGLVVVAVTTPVGRWWAFAAYGLVLVAVASVARLPVRHTLSRMLVEVPFLVAAALVPFTHPDGIAFGATLAAKTTLGTLAMVLLSSTTPFPSLLGGFERLRAPRVILLTVSFMWRYLHVLTEEFARMRLARDARSIGRRSLLTDGTARLVATLFVRSLERGERVYLAMVGRGYTGGVPQALRAPATLGAAELAFAGGLAAAVGAARLTLS